MHINMKYYIVSIGAIFIALGIGMLVGFNLNYDQELSKQQETIISDLDNKFEDLKTTNDNLEESLAALNDEYDEVIEYINLNADKLLANELEQKNIGIISTDKSEDYTNEIESTITKANGNVAFNIVLLNNIYDAKKIQEVSTKLDLEIKDTAGIIDYIIECLKTQEGSSRLAYLQELEIIKVNSISDNYTSYDSVVLTSQRDSKTGKSQFEKIDKILIPKLKNEGKVLVGAQKSDTNFSNIELYSKEKISTVDNLEDGTGKVSLVTILKSGNINGNYGKLDSAESLIPYKK
ncbi:MAG: copper transporter [Peptostreptococcaceae bacterium]